MAKRRSAVGLRWAGLFLLSAGLLAWWGCGPGPTPPTRSQPRQGDSVEPKAPEPSPEKPQLSPEKPQPKAIENPEPTPPAKPQPEKPSPEPAAKPPEPATKIQSLEEQEQHRRLAQARDLVAAGHFHKATEAIESLLQSAPTDATRQNASKLAAVIGQRRQESDALRPVIRLLASTQREEIRTAQDRLFEKSDAALPLLREAVAEDNPVLIRNTLATLQRLGRPEGTLPILVGMLANPARKTYWPDVIHSIETASAPGAGEPLLALFESSDSPAQRIIALEALSRTCDPPPRTLGTLLPLLYEDRPELPGMLKSTAQAIVVYGQSDLVSFRGFDVPPTAQQIALLERLPGRLAQLMSGNASPDVAKAARLLAIVTRQVPPEPISGVKVVAVSGELDGSPASALLDGVWDTIEPAKMWRHPAGKRSWVTLDLGSTRTIVALRIWNLNENGAPQRGWKEVAVSVGDSPMPAAAPVATAIVQRAPGVAKPPDYGTLVPVPLARGRYVRFQMVCPWQQDSHAGLTEAQVLGF